MSPGVTRVDGGHPTVGGFLDHALAGRIRPAVAVALGLLDGGLSTRRIVSELLAPAQLEVGRRWEEDGLSVADEHLATGSAQAAVHALSMAQPVRPHARGQLVLACAEGDWHSLPAHMFALQLEDAGYAVTFLGASTPAADVARLLAWRRPDALVVSCTMAIYFAGVTALANAAHSLGVPVLVGGAALTRGGQGYARALGADAWARDWTDAVATLEGWRSRPPTVPRSATTLPASALQLDREVQGLAVVAAQGPDPQAASGGDESRRAGLEVDDLRLVLQFLAAAQLVRSDEVFVDFVTWLERVLANRGLPQGRLRTELQGLASRLPTLPEEAVELLRRATPTLPSAG